MKNMFSRVKPISVKLIDIGGTHYFSSVVWINYNSPETQTFGNDIVFVYEQFIISFVVLCGILQFNALNIWNVKKKHFRNIFLLVG